MKRIYHETKIGGGMDDGIEVNVYNASYKGNSERIKIIILHTWWDYEEGHEKVVTFLHKSDSFVIREAIRLFDAMVEAHPNL